MKQKIILSSLLSIFALSAAADFPGKSWLEEKVVKDQFDVWIGVQGLAAPTYFGSDDYRYYPLPIVQLETYDKSPSPFIFDSIAGAGVKLVDYHGAYLGVAGYWRPGWSAKDDLKGLDDRDSGLQASALIGYENRYGLDAKIISSWGITGDVKGMLVTGKLEQDLQLSSWWRVTPGVAVSWGSNEYMDNYYGISAEESYRSEMNLSAYDADSGFRDARIYLENTFQVTDNIRLYLDGYIDFILDGAKDSPIVKDVGSDIGYGGSLGISFKF